jgi:signal transduction histidine kinase
MSLDVRRRAFDPFFTTRRDRGGTGLGLHIVHNIVTNRLGGRLDLDSEPGNGTTVRIILPRVAPLQQAAE